MDIFTHAVVGCFTGATVGHPFDGMIAAIVPDIVLGIRRKANPTRFYDCTHSFVGGLSFGLGSLLSSNGDHMVMVAVFLGWLSHAVLDMFTHGKTWAPPLLWPVPIRFSYGQEWEWFNDTWMNGLALSFVWMSICVILMS